MPIVGPVDKQNSGAPYDCIWLALSIAMFCSTKRIDLQISFSAATWLRIALVVGLGFLFVSIAMAAYVGIAPERNNAVSAMVNFMRNMASSVGGAGMRRHEASATAYVSVYESLQAQAPGRAYVDTFTVLCVAAAIMFCLSLFLRRTIQAAV
jgi:DHA2 family multidrug resistance protein